ncbi:MAG: BRCT domain-containing protein, partial [Planctomycetaceae bacterium]
MSSSSVSSPPLRAERVSFTGTLASMTHQKAHELVKQHGGEPMQHVSRRTTMLVIGEEGWPLEEDGRPSQKLLRAWRLREQGIDVHLLSETDWLHLIGLEERQQDARRLYTPAMLSQMLAVPVGTIRA